MNYQKTQKDIVELSKRYFLDTYESSGETRPYVEHVETVVKIAEETLRLFSSVDGTVLLVSVWLHDVGALLGPQEIHEINSEKQARLFLGKQGMDEAFIDKVCHCVISHRNNENKPRTIEAKILIAADSASHLVDGPYLDMAKKHGKSAMIEKLSRDYRDVELVPEVKGMVEHLFAMRKSELEALPVD